MKDKILEAMIGWFENNGYDVDKMNTPLSIGTDSLDHIELALDVEDELGVEISDEWISEEMKDWTLERIAEHLAWKLEAK